MTAATMVRNELPLPEPRAEPDHEPQIDEGREQRERGVYHRLLHDDVQVVEVVPQHRDPDRDREGEEADAADEPAQAGIRDHAADDREDERAEEAERGPLDLLPLDPRGTAEPPEEGVDRQREEPGKQDPRSPGRGSADHPPLGCRRDSRPRPRRRPTRSASSARTPARSTGARGIRPRTRRRYATEAKGAGRPGRAAGGRTRPRGRPAPSRCRSGVPRPRRTAPDVLPSRATSSALPSRTPSP